MKCLNETLRLAQATGFLADSRRRTISCTASSCMSVHRRQDLLVVLDGRDVEDHLRLVGSGDDPRAGAALERALELGGEWLRRRRIEIERVERVVRLAAKMEAAAGERARKDKREAQPGKVSTRH